MDLYSPPSVIKCSLKISEEKLLSEFANDRSISSESGYIEIPEFPDLKYKFGVKVINEKGQKKDKLMAYLTVKKINKKSFICSNCVCYIKSANFVYYRFYIFMSVDYSWEVEVCNLRDLFDPEMKFIVDGEFVIEIKGLVFVKPELKKNYEENYLFKRLWRDEDEKDFLIVGGKENERKTECKVHKCILSAYSPVFKRMFRTDMKEMREGKVEITDFDADTIELAIEFCYGQESSEYEEWQTIIDIIKFADKYDIKKLKRESEFHLVPEISYENICQVTNAVIDLNAPKLLDFCFRCLFLALREGIPIKDMQILNDDFARDLLTKVSSLEYC